MPKIFKLRKPDPRFPKNEYFALSKEESIFVPDPMEVPGKNGKKLWEERLEECRKSDPNVTFKDMCWGLADIPDEFLVGHDYGPPDNRGRRTITKLARNKFL